MHGASCRHAEHKPNVLVCIQSYVGHYRVPNTVAVIAAVVLCLVCSLHAASECNSNGTTQYNGDRAGCCTLGVAELQ